MQPVYDTCVQADAAPRVHALSLPAAHRLAAQLALFALAGLALITRQLYPALEATLAALHLHDHTSATAAYLQVHMAVTCS